MHRLRFPGNPYVGSAAFAADGERLFVHVDGQAVNAWEILVYYWPEGLGAVTAATVLFCSIALRRISRRKRFVGAPHCRRCNYCLTGCTSGRCPECGNAVVRPIRGRPMWLRALPFVLPLAIVVAGYGSLWILRAPRAGYVATWVNWWSYDLHDWARDKGVSLTRWLRQVDRILEVDVESGQTLRTLITRPNRLHPWCPVTVTPDGSGLLMTIDDGDRLALVSTRSGSVMRTLAYGDFASVRTSRWTQIAGFDDAGRTVYIVLLDKPEKKTVLLAWNLRSGESSKLLEVDADIVQSQNGPAAPWARRFYQVPGSIPERFLELPHSMAVGNRGTPTEFNVRGGADLQRIVCRFAKAIWGHSAPSFTSDGRRVYLHGSGFGEGLVAFELETGTALPALHAPPFHNISFQVSKTPQRGWVVIHGSGRPRPAKNLLSLFTSAFFRTDVFLVADLDQRSWIGRYDQPPEGIYLNLFASPDGRFFAANGFLRNSKGAGGRYQQELLIYDLRSLPHDLQDGRELSPGPSE